MNLLLLLTPLAAMPPVSGPHITNIAVYMSAPTAPKGYVLVTLDSEVSKATPHCADGNPNSVAIDLSVAAGALAASELSRASVMQLPVKVTGSGRCDVVSNVETLASVEVGRAPWQTTQ